MRILDSTMGCYVGDVVRLGGFRMCINQESCRDCDVDVIVEV